MRFTWSNETVSRVRARLFRTPKIESVATTSVRKSTDGPLFKRTRDMLEMMLGGAGGVGTGTCFQRTQPGIPTSSTITDIRFHRCIAFSSAGGDRLRRGMILSIHTPRKRGDDDACRNHAR